LPKESQEINYHRETKLRTNYQLPIQMNRKSRKIAKFVGIVVGVAILVILFGLRDVLWAAYIALNTTWRLTLNFLAIATATFIFSGFLVPLEALGWWAGWYGDQIDTTVAPGTLVENLPHNEQVSRYVIYLDGIAQTKYEYLPEVDVFLNQLATVLPDDILIIKGIMPYSPMNRPLTEDRTFAFFWRLADQAQNSGKLDLVNALLTLTILLRNVLIVSVSADQRYGPIYNQSIAQVIYNSLIAQGYQPGSGIPITLLAYSGGGQMAIGSAPYLKRALAAPISTISISGVMSGNSNILELEHLYHFVGDQDIVERIGPVLFPKRWKIFFLSYWNRAKNRGKITIKSLGAVGHNAGGGPYSQQKFLPDGRSYLQQTIDVVAGILTESSLIETTPVRGKPSNYERYYQADFNQPSYYPLDQGCDPDLYRPIATWMGRLILPSLEQRRQIKGVLFEVHHADPEHQHLVGKIVKLRWSNERQVQAFVRPVRKDLHFSEEAEFSQRQGYVHPYRLNHWQQVDPLESLAGARANDDVIVMLREPVEVKLVKENKNSSKVTETLYISREPVQISGRYYGLVKILSRVEDSDRFRVVHFNRRSRQFNGAEEIIYIPQVVADINGVFPSTNCDLEKTPPNQTGWYIYGARNASGMFVVVAIAPRSLLRLVPDEYIVGRTATWNYLKKEAWQIKGEKGRTKSILLSPQDLPIEDTINNWKEGDRALVLHIYGGIGGNKREPAAKTPIFFGHFAYGVAQVLREPLADELMFNIEYHQVYTHNIDGIIAGTLAWNRFIGDRQFGWMGSRPVWDIVIKHNGFTEDFDLKGIKRSALDILVYQLEQMTARYRIGDGTGGTYVGPAHNCSQDSNQAFYAAIKSMQNAIDSNPELVAMLTDDPGEPERYEQLVKIGTAIRQQLLPFGTARADWQDGEKNLGISPEEDFFQNLAIGLISWRTLLPRLAGETIARQFLRQGALVWILRTTQVGGYDPDIEPIVPTEIG
jgi:predicted Abi (CAAX) family protease